MLCGFKVNATIDFVKLFFNFYLSQNSKDNVGKHPGADFVYIFLFSLHIHLEAKVCTIHIIYQV
jgi:hypothetical protein